MKKAIYIFLGMTISFFVIAEDLEQLRWDYQIDQIIEIGESEESSLQEQAEALYYKYKLMSDLDYPLSEISKVIDKAIEKYLQLLELEPEMEVIIAIRLSDLYSGLIVDGGSWMKYNGISNEWKERARSLDSEAKDLLILDLNTLLYFPKEAGGNREEGFLLLEKLLDQYPEDPVLLSQRYDFALDEGLFDESKMYLEKIIGLYPHHQVAKNVLRDIYLSEANLKIEAIELEGEFRSRIEPVDEIIQTYIGMPYTMETKESLAIDLESLPVVTAVSISAKEHNGAVHLTLKPSEEEMSFFGLLLSFGFSGKTNGIPEVKGIPVPILMYNNQNILGRGHRLSVICAWVFYNIDYTIPEQPGLPMDVKFNTKLMFLPSRNYYYNEGKKVDWSQESNFYSISSSLEKNLLGFSSTLGVSSQYTLFQKEKGSMKISENNLTLKGSFGLSYDTGANDLSPVPADGILFSASAEVLYKPEYKAWGPKEDLFDHNTLPGGRYNVEAGYYQPFLSDHLIGIKGNWFSSTNLYQSELWAVGQGDLLNDGPSLAGYYQGEFILESGLIGEMGYYWKINNDNSLYILHNALYAEEEWKQGSTLGTAFKMPGDILVNLSGSIGWDAVREWGRGWQVDVTAARLFF